MNIGFVKILVVLVVVLAFLGGGYFFWWQTDISNKNEKNGSAEVEFDSESLKKLFVRKYPEAEDISVSIDQATEDHIRGGVSFGPESSGGYFFASKIDGEWQIVHDGNGVITCALSDYGFPYSMLSDCENI